MHMILFVLHDTSRLVEVLEGWDAIGVSGITVIPSTGIGRLKEADLLRDDMPLMPSLEDIMECPERFNRTLITIVEDEEMVERVLAATQKIIGDLNDPNTGILAVIPLSRVWGLHRNNQ